MLGGLAKTFLGSSNERYVRSLRSTVNKINALEDSMAAMRDDSET